MSSTAYSADLRPDGRLRCIVLVSAVLLASLGALAIGLATVPAWVRLPALAAWLGWSWRDVGALRRGWRRAHGVRLLADGGAEVRDRSGRWAAAELAGGSMLLRRLGWLRLVTADGERIHELVSGSCREDREWRRLHVIWRHV